MKKYRIPILYNLESLPEKNSTDVYEVNEVDKRIERLKEVARKTLWDWAWWKDGVQYVGSCGTTYKEALAELEKRLREEL